MTHANYTNPFDDEQLEFSVLRNDQQQYSLWPVFASQPLGWRLEFGPGTRADCLEYIERNWTSINPFSTTAKESGHVSQD